MIKGSNPVTFMSESIPPGTAVTLSHTNAFAVTVGALRRPADTFKIERLGVWVLELGEARKTEGHYDDHDVFVPGHTGGPFDVTAIDYPDAKDVWYFLLREDGAPEPREVPPGSRVELTVTNVGRAAARFLAIVEVEVALC